MKKIVVASAISLLALSCGKENGTNKTADAQGKTAENTAAQNIDFAKKHTTTPQKITELLQPKSNDTVYVINFFATWCGPCMREIPEFKAKMGELKGKPVKFTFVNLDDKTNWDTDVKNFAEEQELGNHVLLVDGADLSADFFSKNFKEWKGETIPFTMIRKRDKSQEMQGAMSGEELTKLINSVK